jgi:hypothetical protein
MLRLFLFIQLLKRLSNVKFYSVINQKCKSTAEDHPASSLIIKTK